MREYKSGTGWCLWRWTIVPTNYITRLHLIKTPWFAVCLHWINGPDPEPYFHDHPVSFVSIILRGGYTESRECGQIDRLLFNSISATDKHRIIRVKPNTLTLAFMGPKVRDWGFYTCFGWIGWKEYNKKYKE